MAWLISRIKQTSVEFAFTVLLRHRSRWIRKTGRMARRAAAAIASASSSFIMHEKGSFFVLMIEFARIGGRTSTAKRMRNRRREELKDTRNAD
jgi:hypothetical protein